MVGRTVGTHFHYFYGRGKQLAKKCASSKLRSRNAECASDFNCVSNPGYVVYTIYG
jgi:hypothetical protein